MRTAERQGPLQWGMAWTAWLTYQIERKAEFPGLNFEHAIPAEAPVGTVENAVERAVADLVERHEGLRTTFGADEEGLPLQTVWAAEPVPLHRLDRAADPEGVEVFKTRDFAVDAEWPCRFALVAEADGGVSLLACFPHITVDDHARNLLAQDFAELLEAALAGRAPDLPPVGTQPVDYARYERSAAASRTRERAERYWQDGLDRMPVGLFDTGETPERTRGVFCQRRSRESAQRLQRIATRAGVPMSAVVSAVFAVALRAAAAKEALAFNIASHGRVTPNALEVVAPLARELVVQVGLQDDQSFEELSGELHRLTFEAVRHGVVDSARLSEWKALAGTRNGGEVGSRISLNFIDKRGAHRADEDAEWTCAVGDETPYDAASHHLYTAAAVTDETLELIVFGCGAVLGAPVVEALARSLTDLLELVDRDPKSTVGDLRLAVEAAFPDRSQVRAGASRGRDAEAEAALRRFVREANGLASADLSHSYVAAGGRFVRIPEVLHLLGEAGYEGLGWHDLLLPCALSELATRLVAAP